MKKKYILALLLSPLFVFLVSCEKYIEFSGEITEPLLVVNSIVNPDSAVSAHISQSRFVLGKTSPIVTVENAAVNVFVNDALKEKLIHKGGGMYKGSYFPKPSDKIRIEVTVPQFETVEATTVVPENVNLTLNSFGQTVKESSPGAAYVEVNMKMTLSDNAKEENFYFIKGYRNVYANGMLQYSHQLDLKLSDVLKNNQVSGSNDFFSELLGEDTSGTQRIKNIFNDAFVNGKDIALDFTFSEFPKHSNYEEIEYEIQVAQMSKDLYQYLLSANKAMESNDIPIVESVQVHSNTTNGVGILGSFNLEKVVRRVE